MKHKKTFFLFFFCLSWIFCLNLFFFVLASKPQANFFSLAKLQKQELDYSPHPNAKEAKLFCSKDELKTKNCFLSLFVSPYQYKIFLSYEKIRLNNGVWRSLSEIPKHGKEVEWEQVKVIKKNGRLLLQLFLWGLQGYGEVQSLYWDIYEIKGVQMSRVLSEVIQKRRKNITKWRTRSFLYDKKEQFGLKTEGSSIKWFVKHRTGQF